MQLHPSRRGGRAPSPAPPSFLLYQNLTTAVGELSILDSDNFQLDSVYIILGLNSDLDINPSSKLMNTYKNLDAEALD